MKMANSAVSLQELGISDLRAGRAVIGALVFEVRGPEGSAKAAALAEKLAGLFAEREDVRLACPRKTAELPQFEGLRPRRFGRGGGRPLRGCGGRGVLHRRD